MYCDFHTHLYLYSNIETIVREINDNNILTVASSIDVESYLRTLDIAKSSPLIIPTFGIHPSKAHSYSTRLSEIDDYLKRSPLIGEIGLDYLWVDPVNKPAQKKVFRYISEKAVELDKYIVIHTKDAEDDILEILGELNAKKVIIHWYSGPLDTFREYIKRGWYFTFGIELEYSPHIRSLAVITPKDRLLTETDNPVGVEWLTGRTGMPSDIAAVYRILADTIELKPEQLKTLIGKNMNRVLNGF